MALRRRISQGPNVIEPWPDPLSSDVGDGSNNFVIYARSSTRRRHEQRLSYQVEDIEDFVAERGGEVIATFREIGQSEDENLPARMEAINLALDEHATLIVRWIDRFSRDSNFVRGWLNMNLRLQVVSHPEASRNQLLSLAFIALQDQVEREERLADGRYSARRRGARIGDDGTGAFTRQRRARRRAQRVMVIVRHLKRSGFENFREVAQELNRIGVRTPSGRGGWSHTQIERERVTASLNQDGGEGRLGPVRFPIGVWERVLPEIFETEEQGIEWVRAEKQRMRNG